MDKSGHPVIHQTCHLDFYFFFLAGVEFVGLLLFLMVIKLCQVQKEISIVGNNKSDQQPISDKPSNGRLKSSVSVQRQNNSDISVT